MRITNLCFEAIWSTPVIAVKTDNIWVWPDEQPSASGNSTGIKSGTSGGGVVKIIQDPQPTTLLDTLGESIEISSDSDEPLSRTKEKQKSVRILNLKIEGRPAHAKINNKVKRKASGPEGSCKKSRRSGKTVKTPTQAQQNSSGGNSDNQRKPANSKTSKTKLSSEDPFSESFKKPIPKKSKKRGLSVEKSEVRKSRTTRKAPEPQEPKG